MVLSGGSRWGPVIGLDGALNLPEAAAAHPHRRPLSLVGAAWLRSLTAALRLYLVPTKV